MFMKPDETHDFDRDSFLEVPGSYFLKFHFCVSGDVVKDGLFDFQGMIRGHNHFMPAGLRKRLMKSRTQGKQTQLETKCKPRLPFEFEK